jgi:probable HAF family extracellular repeat protein
MKYMILTFLAANLLTAQQPYYSVVDLGTLGGSSSTANSLNDLGWASGASNVTGNSTVHATLWLYPRVIDLGTLGGPNSAIDWPVKNDLGELAGNAETAALDPLGENFCRYGTGHICLGFFWQRGVMHGMLPLPTLGGNNGYAAGINNRGEIVGWAEASTPDSTCILPQVLQYEAVIWGPAKGQIRQLSPLPGDPDGAAVAANDLGQVVGISGPCGDADGLGAAHAVLWENGTVINLGNFGGMYFNTADAINNKGHIVGFSDFPGDEDGQPNFHAFLYTKTGGLQDLGTLPGDSYSEATDINEDEQIVGQSCDIDLNCRGFLWQGGVMTDLNTLTPSGSLYVTYAGSINSSGEIAGEGLNQETGATPAVLLTPPTAGAAAAIAAAHARGEVPKVTLPAGVRQSMRTTHGRFGIGPMNAR